MKQGNTVGWGLARTGVTAVRMTGLGLFGLVILTMLLPRFTAIPYERTTALLAFAVFALIAWLGIRYLPSVPQRVARNAALPVGILCWAVSTFVGYATYYVTTWDSKLIQNIVTLPADEVTRSHLAYMARYPNNEALLALARVTMKFARAVGWDYGTAFLVNLSAALALTLAGVYLLTARLAGRASGLAAMGVVTLLVGISPWMSVPYTDIPSMWIPVWAVYCFVRARRARSGAFSCAWVLTGAALLGLGYNIKTTPIVGIVAAAVWFVGLAAIERSAKALAACGLALVSLVAGTALGVLGTQVLVRPLTDLPPVTPGVAASPWHYVASGLRVQEGPNDNRIFGGYDRAVNTATSGKPTAVQTRISKNFIRSELERRGAVGTMWFAVNKLDFNWGDGMFWAYGEGTDLSRKPIHDGTAVEWVQEWNSPSGDLFATRVALVQGLWWLTLSMVALGWLRGRVTPESALVVLTVLGIAAFTLVFQGRSRYLVPHVPLIAVAAVAWWGQRGVVRPTLPRRYRLIAPVPDSVTRSAEHDG